MGLMSSVTDAIGITDTGSGAQAAARAGEASAAQALQARGAVTQAQANAQSALYSGFGQGMKTLRPLVAGGTPQGFSSNIMELMQGGALDPLISENRRNLMGELSAQGLTRSGAGIQELSQLPINTIMGIEGDLYGRSSNALGNIANLQTGLAQQVAGGQRQYGQQLSNIFTGQGQDQASAILAGQQAEAAERSALGNLVGAGAMAYGMS